METFEILLKDGTRCLLDLPHCNLTNTASSYSQPRLCSDCVDAQADLSLPCTHTWLLILPQHNKITPSLIRVFTVCMKKPWDLSYSLSTQRKLTGLGRCSGWSESSLGAQVILLLLSCCGSIGFALLFTASLYIKSTRVSYQVTNLILGVLKRKIWKIIFKKKFDSISGLSESCSHQTQLVQFQH